MHIVQVEIERQDISCEETALPKSAGGCLSVILAAWETEADDHWLPGLSPVWATLQEPTFAVRN